MTALALGLDLFDLTPAQSAPPAGKADKAEVAVAAAHEVCDEMCSDTMYSEIGTDGMLLSVKDALSV